MTPINGVNDMSESTAPIAPLRYRGSYSQYVDIAIRGEEHLGISAQYQIHPSNVGFVIIRFVSHGAGKPKPENYTRLSLREGAKFKTFGDHSEVFHGVRLNKVAVPVFKPAVQPFEVGAFAVTSNLYPTLAAWVAEQITAEGFELTVPDVAALIQDQIEIQPTDPSTVESVVEFPDLTDPKNKTKAKKSYTPDPEPEDEEDEDGDESDEESEDWLN